MSANRLGQPSWENAPSVVPTKTDATRLIFGYGLRAAPFASQASCFCACSRAFRTAFGVPAVLVKHLISNRNDGFLSSVAGIHKSARWFSASRTSNSVRGS